jgi:hypothetical protein
MPWCRKCGSGSERAWLLLVFREYGPSIRRNFREAIRTRRSDQPPQCIRQSKEAGEKAIREHHSDWCIARISWLFDAAGAVFRRRFFVPPRRSRPGEMPWALSERAVEARQVSLRNRNTPFAVQRFAEYAAARLRRNCAIRTDHKREEDYA